MPRLYFITKPATASTYGLSAIPPGLDGCDVVDVVTTTNAAYHGDGPDGEWGEWGDTRAVAECAKLAAGRGVPLLIDGEVKFTRPAGDLRNTLDVWLEGKSGRAKCKAAAEYTSGLCREATAAAPGLRYGLYAKLPAWTGLHRNQFDPKDRRAHIGDEAHRLRMLPAFTVVDEYPVLHAGQSDDDVLKLLEDALADSIIEANGLGYGPNYRETVLLITDVIYRYNAAGTFDSEGPVSAWLLNEMLGLAVRTGLTPAVWNSNGSGELVDVYREFSKRAA